MGDVPAGATRTDPKQPGRFDDSGNGRELIVRRTGDFTLGLAPTTVTVPAGNDAVAAVNVLPRVGSTSPAPT